MKNPIIETKEDLEKELQRLKEERQENFMNKILLEIQVLNEKVSKEGYKPTVKEMESFREIYNNIIDINTMLGGDRYE